MLIFRGVYSLTQLGLVGTSYRDHQNYLLLEDPTMQIYAVYIPKGFMYGIFTYIWLIFLVNVGMYTIHGSSGIYTVEF